MRGYRALPRHHPVQSRHASPRPSRQSPRTQRSPYTDTNCVTLTPSGSKSRVAEAKSHVRTHKQEHKAKLITQTNCALPQHHRVPSRRASPRPSRSPAAIDVVAPRKRESSSTRRRRRESG